MKITLVILVAVVASGIIAVLLLNKSNPISQRHHYVLKQFEEHFPNRNETKSIFKMDATTGKTWRLSRMTVASGVTIEAWDEIPSSLDNELQKRFPQLYGDATPAQPSQSPARR